jgi:hypothetical protein
VRAQLMRLCGVVCYVRGLSLFLHNKHQQWTDVLTHSQRHPSAPISSPAPEPEPEPDVRCCARTPGQTTKNTICLACNPDPHILPRLRHRALRHRRLQRRRLFPSRCYKAPIPLELCPSFITDDLMKEMETKQQEHVEANTVHYSWKDCGIAIPQVNIEAGIGTCQACQERTYTIYKEEARVDVLCPVNDEVKELMATAGCVVWQTCKKCNVRSRTGQQRT